MMNLGEDMTEEVCDTLFGVSDKILVYRLIIKWNLVIFIITATYLSRIAISYIKYVHIKRKYSRASKYNHRQIIELNDIKKSFKYFTFVIY